MARSGKTNGSAPASASEGITRISVAGFKSIRDEQSIEIRPLTILAGANSSGKSSIMQPLLLMKQTIESPFDPETFQLNGSNVKFTSIKDFLTQKDGQTRQFGFRVKIDYANSSVSLTYDWLTDLFHSANIAMRYKQADREILIAEGLPPDEALAQLEKFEGTAISTPDGDRLATLSNRCFIRLVRLSDDGNYYDLPMEYQGANPTERLQILVHQVLHIPGVRKPPDRTYPVARITVAFPGVFDNYVGSILLHWMESNPDQWKALIHDMRVLSLANYITAERLNDTQIEVRVNRSRTSSETDTVSIADVGIGVSQALPVLAALRAARPGQLVYIEQPELHIHPRAQVAMAQVLANAALRGVRVVVETHSSLLLLGVQTLVAEGKLDSNLVKLHWFTRDDTGNTKVDSADVDDAGAFGEWPEDFGDVELHAQGEYLDAARMRLKRGVHAGKA